MFISKAEKEELRISVRTLQAQSKEINQLIKDLNDRFNRLAAYALKKKARVETLERIMKITPEKMGDIDKTLEPVFRKVRTGEAPWGYKKDGTPRKRPGRPIPTVAKGEKV